MGPLKGKRVDPFPYEWMGPPGALVIMLALPVVVYGLHFACNAAHCLSLDPLSPDFLRLDAPFTAGLRPFLASLFSVRATVVYLLWLALHFVLYLVVPASVVQGSPLDEEGHRLSYPLNGLSSSLISVAVVVALVWMGLLPVSCWQPHRRGERGPHLSAGRVADLRLLPCVLRQPWHPRSAFL